MRFEEIEAFYIYSFLFSQIEFGEEKSKRDEFVSSLKKYYPLASIKIRTFEEDISLGEKRTFKFDIPYLWIKELPQSETITVQRRSDQNTEEIAYPVTEIVYRVYESGLGVQRIKIARNQPQEQEMRELSGITTELFHFFEDGVKKLYEGICRVTKNEAQWLDQSVKILEEESEIWQNPCLLTWLRVKPEEGVSMTFRELLTNKKDFLKGILCGIEPGYNLDNEFLTKFGVLNNPDSLPVNMSYHDKCFIHFLSRHLLLITAADDLDLDRFTERNLLPRILELLELSRGRYHAQTVGNVLLDKKIQQIQDIFTTTVINFRESDKKDIKLIITQVKNFLNEWIELKTNILRMLEDPSIHRSGGPTFEVLYKRICDTILIDQLQHTLELKLRQLDRVYDDIMDYLRLSQLEQMK